MEHLSCLRCPAVLPSCYGVCRARAGASPSTTARRPDNPLLTTIRVWRQYCSPPSCLHRKGPLDSLQLAAQGPPRVNFLAYAGLAFPPQ